MSQVKRGADSQYPTLNIKELKKLDVDAIAAEDAILVFWVPSSLLKEGLDIMAAWGFPHQTQTYIWVKHKKEPLLELFKSIKGALSDKNSLKDLFQSFDLNKILNFGMGRLFRQTHEIALVAKRGRIYDKLENKSQRSVILDVNKKHSAKPEGLQDSLDIMFPNGNKLELFARRQRPGWECVGNEMPLSEDVRDSIERLKGL